MPQHWAANNDLLIGEMHGDRSVHRADWLNRYYVYRQKRLKNEPLVPGP